MLDDDAQDRCAANLRRLRIARHLSLSELARATAISKATLSSIENGRANPTVETLAALAGALRVPLTRAARGAADGRGPGRARRQRAVEPGDGDPTA